MKKIFSAAVVILLFASLSANGQAVKTGILAGFTSSSANIKDFDVNSVSLYHAGITFNIPIVAGFAIQPSLLYQVKGAKVKDAKEMSAGAAIRTLHTEIGYLELPVQLQWGPDLGLFRPYVFAEPFVGIGINTKNAATTFKAINEKQNDFEKAAIKRLEYGLGLGAGVEFWRLQLSVRYFWNLGPLYDGKSTVEETKDAIARAVGTAFKENRNFNGITASVAIFF